MFSYLLIVCMASLDVVSAHPALLPPDVRQGHLSPLVHFSSGLIAGALASVATQPADVIKTKMQLYPHKFANIYQVRAVFSCVRWL